MYCSTLDPARDAGTSSPPPAADRAVASIVRRTARPLPARADRPICSPHRMGADAQIPALSLRVRWQLQGVTARFLRHVGQLQRHVCISIPQELLNGVRRASPPLHWRERGRREVPRVIAWLLGLIKPRAGQLVLEEQPGWCSSTLESEAVVFSRNETIVQKLYVVFMSV